MASVSEIQVFVVLAKLVAGALTVTESNASAAGR